MTGWSFSSTYQRACGTFELETPRDRGIANHVADMYQIFISSATISAVTEKIIERVKASVKRSGALASLSFKF